MSEFRTTGSDLFGRYCLIEMYRYGTDNEFFVHKIVRQYKCNRYCDVPLRGGYDHEPVLHHEIRDAEFPDNLEDVIDVIQCGVDETHVFTVALKDVKLLSDNRDKLIEHLKAENGSLKELAHGLLYCLDDGLDAHDCPLYDEGEPNKCKVERLIRETGLRDGDS